MLSFYGYTSDMRTVWSPVAGTSLFTLTMPSEWQTGFRSCWPHPHTRPCTVIKMLPCFLWVPSKLSFTSYVFTVFSRATFHHCDILFLLSPRAFPILQFFLFHGYTDFSWNFSLLLMLRYLLSPSFCGDRRELIFCFLGWFFLKLIFLKKFLSSCPPPPTFFGGGIDVMILIFLLIVNLNTQSWINVQLRFLLTSQTLPWKTLVAFLLFGSAAVFSTMFCAHCRAVLFPTSPCNHLTISVPPVRFIHLQPSGVSGSVTGHENGPSATSHLQRHLPDHLEGSTGSAQDPFWGLNHSPGCHPDLRFCIYFWISPFISVTFIFKEIGFLLDVWEGICWDSASPKIIITAIASARCFAYIISNSPSSLAW